MLPAGLTLSYALFSATCFETGGIDPIWRNFCCICCSFWCAQITKKWELPCVIAETSYPTEGPVQTTPEGSAMLGYNRGNVLWADIEAQCRSENVPVYSFEPFDGIWKYRFHPFIKLDYSFGIMTCDRKVKRGSSYHH